MSSSTKTELVAAVARRTGTSRAAARKVLDATLDEILDSMRAGGRLPIEGFGTFEVVTRGPRKGRNPRTGEAIDIPERPKVKFTAGKYLKSATDSDGPEGDVFSAAPAEADA